MPIEWDVLVERTLANGVQACSGPIPGAKFRQMIAAEATKEGLAFPPPGMQRFSKFVEQYPSKLIVQRRPGQDFLVAPANTPQLLATDSFEGAARLRDDIFRALTQIPLHSKGIPFYFPAQDAIQWLNPDEPKPADAIEMPTATLEHELGDRTAFANEPSIPELAKQAILEALKGSAPLGAFTGLNRDYGLTRQWHEFRMKQLVERLRVWAKSKNISWQSGWIQERQVQKSFPQPVADAVSLDGMREFMTSLAGELRESDLARISVPLDLVLRVLRNKG